MACSDQRKAFQKEDKSEITPNFAKALEIEPAAKKINKEKEKKIKDKDPIKAHFTRNVNGTAAAWGSQFCQTQKTPKNSSHDWGRGWSLIEPLAC